MITRISIIVLVFFIPDIMISLSNQVKPFDVVKDGENFVGKDQNNINNFENMINSTMEADDGHIF